MLWPLLLLGAWDRLLLSACGAGRWAAPLAGLGAGLLLVALLRHLLEWSEETNKRRPCRRVLLLPKGRKHWHASRRGAALCRLAAQRRAGGARRSKRRRRRKRPRGRRKRPRGLLPGMGPMRSLGGNPAQLRVGRTVGIVLAVALLLADCHALLHRVYPAACCALLLHGYWLSVLSGLWLLGLKLAFAAGVSAAPPHPALAYGVLAAEVLSQAHEDRSGAFLGLLCGAWALGLLLACAAAAVRRALASPVFVLGALAAECLSALLEDGLLAPMALLAVGCATLGTCSLVGTRG